MQRVCWFRIFICPLLACLCGCSLLKSKGPDQQLSARLDEILSRHAATGATYVARVLELPSRRELYAVNIDRPVIPASNLKLFATSTAIDQFGPDHTFKTYLAMDGDDLWIIGTGDPGIGDPKIAAKYKQKITTVFDEWLAALRAHHIYHVSGKLIYFQGALDRQWVHPSWSRSFIGDWYAAPVTGLNFCDNDFDFTAEPAEKGQPATVQFEPAARNIKVINKTISASTQPFDITRDVDSQTYTLVGGVTKKEGPVSKSVVDPGAYFADALRTHLQSHGLTIDGPTTEALSPLGGRAEPPAEKIIAIHETKMIDCLWRINKNSQNLFAEAFSKLNGKKYQFDRGRYVPGSWADGGIAAHEFLKAHQIDDSHIVLADGSGLSRQNRVTSRAITDLLATMYDHPNGKYFRQSLGISGIDGTIEKRMHDIAGKVQGKTGYIGGVRALSGYADTDDGRTLCFSIIYNDIPGNVNPYEDLQDEACRVLVKGPKYVPKPTSQPTTRPSRSRLTSRPTSQPIPTSLPTTLGAPAN